MRDLYVIMFVFSSILIFMAIYLILLTKSNHKEKNEKWFDSDDSHIY